MQIAIIGAGDEKLVVHALVFALGTAADERFVDFDRPGHSAPIGSRSGRIRPAAPSESCA